MAVFLWVRSLEKNRIELCHANDSLKQLFKNDPLQ